MSKLELITLNIGNPSLERAKKQIKWIEERKESVIVLTETKNSEGCNYIADYFMNYGYNLFSLNNDTQYFVYFPHSQTNDLGVMIISKYPFLTKYSIFEQDNQFYSRFAACEIQVGNKKVSVIGLYVPSRDASIEKINRKKSFCTEVANYLKSKKLSDEIICGDFNILSKDHLPHYSTFLNWEYRFYDLLIELGYIDSFTHCNPNSQEYSWVGRTNDGYRYDYIFCSNKLQQGLESCNFIHDTRKDLKITDHSAINISLNLNEEDKT